MYINLHINKYNNKYNEVNATQDLVSLNPFYLSGLQALISQVQEIHPEVTLKERIKQGDQWINGSDRDDGLFQKRNKAPASKHHQFFNLSPNAVLMSQYNPRHVFLHVQCPRKPCSLGRAACIAAEFSGPKPYSGRGYCHFR